MCNRLLQAPFDLCHNTLDPRSGYLSSCTYDVCGCSDGASCLCSAIASYVHDCAQKGVVINWRNAKVLSGCSKCLLLELLLSLPTSLSLLIFVAFVVVIAPVIIALVIVIVSVVILCLFLTLFLLLFLPQLLMVTLCCSCVPIVLSFLWYCHCPVSVHCLCSCHRSCCYPCFLYVIVPVIVASLSLLLSMLLLLSLFLLFSISM